MRLSREEVRLVWESDRKKERRRLLLVVCGVLILFFLTLCFRKDVAYYVRKFTPVENFKSYLLGIKLLLMRIIDPSSASNQNAVIESTIGTDIFGGATGRLKVSIMTFTAGAGLAIAGAVFQTAYKNPMASPNNLGVAAGVNLGNVLMVIVYEEVALQKIYTRYKYCYALTAVCVVVVLLLGRLSGNKGRSTTVVEMVMAGSIVSQLINAFVQYYMYHMEDEELEIYQQMSLGAILNVDTVSFTLFIAAMAISILPVLLCRYKMNVIALDQEEAKLLGLNDGPWRFIAQICGVIMSTAAMIHLGEIGMITMVVPYVVRKIFGTDFRRLCVYSVLVGGSIVMICQFIASFFMINDTVLPATFVVNIVTLPIFMVILVGQRTRTDVA